MNENQLYTEAFYDEQEERSGRNARAILPIVIEKLSPKSVIDFGCGQGIWLKCILDIDDKIDILGIDGEWVNYERLKIPIDNFLPHNLGERINIDKKFDLAMSLEVAEHIEKRKAAFFCENIMQTSNHILFSAAIPGQGGVGHINEQWHEYWIDIFNAGGYRVDYSLRNYFWNNKMISPWRRQNLLYFYRDNDSPFTALKNNMINVVHPDVFEYRKK